MPLKRRVPRRPKRAPRDKAMKKVAHREAIRVVRRNHPLQYFDVVVSTNVTSTTGNVQLLDPLLTNGGILDTDLAGSNLVRHFSAAGVIQDTEARRVHVLGCYFRLRAVAAQATAVLTTDLFNVIRYTMFWSDASYRDTVTQTLNDVDGMFDTRDVARKYVDRTVTLGQKTFQSNDYSSPEQRFHKRFFRIGRVIECYSNNAGSLWDTKKGTFRLQYVSDSGATPHPTLAGTIRVYFKLLD